MVPLPAARSSKPRRSGLTMIVDQGSPLGSQADLLELAGDYADLAKIKTGTARLYPEKQDLPVPDYYAELYCSIRSNGL